jgi:serine O-acetyltransferase
MKFERRTQKLYYENFCLSEAAVKIIKVGTVFGETAKIGDDCYILGGVTLGACGISNNINGKRHPTIGNRVQVGAFSRIFGTVNIGDDVFIGPHCTITEDISENSRVILRTSLQVTKKIAPIKLLSLVN